MNRSIQALTKQNAEQHADISEKVATVSNRVFRSNGERALVEETAENTRNIIELKKVAHPSRMGAARFRADGVKIGGAAGVFLVIDQACSFIASHWAGWASKAGGWF